MDIKIDGDLATAWTRDGRRLIYASSALGEQNFEIYMTDADPGDLPGSNGTIKYGSGRRRLTHFDHAGGVPAHTRG